MVFNESINDYCVAILTIVAALNGVAIPLSYNIISQNLSPYFDKNLSRLFLDEKAFKANVIVSIYALPYFAFPLIIDIKSILDIRNNNNISTAFTNLYFLGSFFFIAGFLICFIEFSKMIYDYASNTEEIVYQKIKKEIDNYLDE